MLLDARQHVRSALRLMRGQADPDQTETRRPGPGVAGLSNLFVIGDATAAAGMGGEISAESAIRLYEKICG